MWFGHVTRRYSLCILSSREGIIDCVRRWGRQRKSWVDITIEWTIMTMPDILTKSVQKVWLGEGHQLVLSRYWWWWLWWFGVTHPSHALLSPIHYIATGRWFPSDGSRSGYPILLSLKRWNILWAAVAQRSTNYLASAVWLALAVPPSAHVVAIATRTDLLIPWTYIHLQSIYTSGVILYVHCWP